MEILLLVIIFVLGLCCGSFVNMLIYRVAINYKLESRKFKVKSKRRSFCDYCGKQLSWFENIPVISWIIQRGETRCCGKKLSILYPIVEFTTGILFLLSFQFLISNFQLINFWKIVQLCISFLIIVFLVFSAVFDLKYMILPDFSTVILVSSSLVLWISRYFGDWTYIWSALGSFLFLDFLYLITKKKGMGFGDVKLAVFMGLFLGYPKIIVAFYTAFIVGAAMSLILMILKKATKKTQIPFGPFLIFGTLVAWFWGEQLISLSAFQLFR